MIFHLVVYFKSAWFQNSAAHSSCAHTGDSKPVEVVLNVNKYTYILNNVRALIENPSS